MNAILETEDFEIVETIEVPPGIDPTVIVRRGKTYVVNYASRHDNAFTEAVVWEAGP